MRLYGAYFMSTKQLTHSPITKVIILLKINLILKKNSLYSFSLLFLKFNVSYVPTVKSCYNYDICPMKRNYLCLIDVRFKSSFSNNKPHLSLRRDDSDPT